VKIHPGVWAIMIVCSGFALLSALTPCMEFGASSAYVRSMAPQRLSVLFVGLLAAIAAFTFFLRTSAPGGPLADSRRVGIGCFTAVLFLLAWGIFGYLAQFA
jgi:hypothetical protein